MFENLAPFSAAGELWHIGAMPSDSDKFKSMVSGLRSNGMTMRAIATATGLSTATICRMDAGEAKAPSYETVKRIERAWTKAGKPEGK